MSPRPPPKISLKHEWKKELGSEVARQPEGEVARQPEGEVARLTKSSQPTQPTPNPIRERTGRPVANTAVAKDSSRVRSSHESDTFNVEDEVHRKRMEQSIADHDDIHESMMVHEADMDFRIPGLPHSVVKYAQSTSVRQLIQKIENLPDRHALQQDLRQNLSFNPFIPESKQMDSQSSAHKGLRIFRFCIVSWKDEREPSIKHSMGRKIGMVRNISGIQRLGQN